MRQSARLWVCTALLFFITISALQWKRPAIEDEVLFHRDAYSWVTRGPNLQGLSHTPLYWEALRSWQKLVGVAEPSKPESVAILRSLGTVAAVATAGLLALGLSLLGAPASAFLLVCLFLVHPYVVQYSLILDIDNTILTPVLLAWVILVELWDRKPRGCWGLTLGIAATFALAMMIKELTPLICLPIWVFYALVRGLRTGKPISMIHVVQALVGAVAGCALFAGLLWLWTRARGFDFLAPLAITFDKVGRGEAKLGGKSTPWRYWGLSRLLFLDYLPLLWLSPSMLAGLWLLFRNNFRGRLQPRAVLAMPLAAWFALAVLAAYSWIVQASFYFPKYSSCVLVLMLFALALHMPPVELKKLSARDAALATAVFGIGFIPALDPMQIVEWRASLGEPRLLALHALALALPCTALWLARKRRGAVFVVLIASLAGLSVGQLWRENTGYLYGEEGFHQAIREAMELKARVSPDKPVMSTARDIAWFLSGNARYNEIHFYDDGGTPLDTKVLVSRSYGAYSIANQPHAKRDAEAKFKCHKLVRAPGERFEIWWIPLSGESCEQESPR